MKFTKIFAGLVMAGALAACSQVSETVSGVTNAATSAVSGVADAAGSAVSGVANAAGSAVNGVTNAASSAVNGAKDMAGSAVNGVKSAANGAKEMAGSAVDGVKNAANSVMGAKPEFKTAAYFCDAYGYKNQVVSATYAFVQGKPYSATVTINSKAKGKQVVGAEMKLDASYKDGVRFVEGKKFWNLDSNFSAATVAKSVPVMFTDNNKILAKNCKIAK